MAGHSQFKNIMHRKGAQDQKRAKIFTKLGKEISVAVKLGSADVNTNARLRAAILEARSANMPKDNIERAIKRASGNDMADAYENVRYEANYKNVAIIIEALTDNRNRTASEVRTAINKANGILGSDGSVAFKFNHVGSIEYAKESLSYDNLLEHVINAGANDVESTEESMIVITDIATLHSVHSYLDENIKNTQAIATAVVWNPKIEYIATINDLEEATHLMKLIDTLEDLDDVQKVFTNLNLSENILKQMNS